MYTPVLANPVLAPSHAVPSLVWRTTTAGSVVVARLDGRNIAGISGPWAGRYALTWWSRPSHPSMDIFDSLEEAQAAVENWALRVRAHEPNAVVARLLESWDTEGREVTSADLARADAARAPFWRRLWSRWAGSSSRPDWSSLGNTLSVC